MSNQVTAADGALSAQSLEIMRKALSGPGAPVQDVNKAITTATGLVYYDLQAPAKNLYPVLTPLRNKIPRVKGKGGTATNWRQVDAITGSGFGFSPWVPEGQRAATMSYSTSNKAASYVTIGEEDSMTYEAWAAAAGFEDEKSMMALRLLKMTMIKEEIAILGDRKSVV